MKRTLLILTFLAVSLAAHAQDSTVDALVAAVRAQGINNSVPDYKVWVDTEGHGYVNDKSFRELQLALYSAIVAGVLPKTETCEMSMFSGLRCSGFAFATLFSHPYDAQQALDIARESANAVNTSAPVQPKATAPRLIHVADPVFPAVAYKLKIGGVVVVSVLIDKDGNATDCRVVKTRGYGLDDAAIAAVKQYKFEPATLNGEAVSVTVNVEVNFRIN
jgi:TonB family protein